MTQSEEMLEFISGVMDQLQNGPQAQTDAGRFQRFQDEMVSANKLALIGKLVPTEPLDETLVQQIRRERTLWLQNGSLQREDLEAMLRSPHWLNRVTNELGLADKWALVDLFTDRARSRCLESIKQTSEQLETLKAQLDQKEIQRMRGLMRSLDVVAMTTTGAVKYRQRLREAGAKVVMVEEAAEVLEAQVVTSVAPETQQLILIGDHQQLKPKVNTFRLAEDFGLSVSLFERLVDAGVPNAKLNEQRRMRPEISRLVRHLYPDLRDHPSVLQYESVR